MRRSLLVFVLLAATSLAHAQRTVSSEEGRWSLQLPAGFTLAPEQKVPMSTAIGDVTMTMTVAQSSDGNNAVMIAYCDYPKAIFNSTTVNRSETIKHMLDTARAGGLRNVPKSKLISEKNMYRNGMSGRSIMFSGMSQGKKIYARFDYYIDVPRLYQVGYITTNSASIESQPIQIMFLTLAVRPAPVPPDTIHEPDVKMESSSR